MMTGASGGTVCIVMIKLTKETAKRRQETRIVKPYLLRAGKESDAFDVIIRHQTFRKDSSSGALPRSRSMIVATVLRLSMNLNLHRDGYVSAVQKGRIHQRLPGERIHLK